MEKWSKNQKLEFIKWTISENRIDLEVASGIINPAYEEHVKMSKKDTKTKERFRKIAESKGMQNKKWKLETTETRDNKEMKKRPIDTQLSKTTPPPIGKNPLPQRFTGSKSGLILLPEGLRQVSKKLETGLTRLVRNVHEEVYDQIITGTLYVKYEKNEKKEKIIVERFGSGPLSNHIYHRFTNPTETSPDDEKYFLEECLKLFEKVFKKNPAMLERFSGMYYAKNEKKCQTFEAYVRNTARFR